MAPARPCAPATRCSICSMPAVIISCAQAIFMLLSCPVMQQQTFVLSSRRALWQLVYAKHMLRLTAHLLPGAGPRKEAQQR